MDRTRTLAAIIEGEDDGYVALCPELDVASRGSTVEEAKANLVEAWTLFLESASASELQRHLPAEVFVKKLEVPIG
jgi:predicted RNase H-like HicB family nuclease